MGVETNKHWSHKPTNPFKKKKENYTFFQCFVFCFENRLMGLFFLLSNFLCHCLDFGEGLVVAFLIAPLTNPLLLFSLLSVSHFKVFNLFLFFLSFQVMIFKWVYVYVSKFSSYWLTIVCSSNSIHTDTWVVFFPFVYFFKCFDTNFSIDYSYSRISKKVGRFLSFLFFNQHSLNVRGYIEFFGIFSFQILALFEWHIP